MPTYDRLTMCHECPFRAAAPAGWLGPWTVEDVLHMLRRDADFICHTDLKRLDESEAQQRGQHCVGFLRYQRACKQLSRDPVKAAAQGLLDHTPDVPVLPMFSFGPHHQRAAADASSAPPAPAASRAPRKSTSRRRGRSG